MKKVVLFAGFALLAVSVFGQSLAELKKYTLISGYSINGTVQDTQPNISKYAITSGGGRIYLDFSNVPIISTQLYQFIELTPTQFKELESIQQEGDQVLILFTRVNKKVTYKTPTGDMNLPYKYVADYIIPYKNILGIKSSEISKKLPEDFWRRNRNLDDVTKLYLETGKADADGRIAKNLIK